MPSLVWKSIAGYGEEMPDTLSVPPASTLNWPVVKMKIKWFAPVKEQLIPQLLLMIWNLWCNQKTTVCLFVLRTISPAIRVTGRVEGGLLGPIPAVFRCRWGYKQITSSWQDNIKLLFTLSHRQFSHACFRLWEEAGEPRNNWLDHKVIQVELTTFLQWGDKADYCVTVSP